MKIVENRAYWRDLWDHQADLDDIFSQSGRTGNSYVSFFLVVNDICAPMEFGCFDSVLDAGGGVGMISICLSPFIRNITLVTMRKML